MGVKDRLKDFINYSGITQRDFEQRWGVSNGYVNSIKVSISDDKLEQLSNNFPELNTVWLKMGIGEMLTPLYRTENIERTEHLTEKYIPLIPVDAVAGYAAGDSQIMEYDTQRYLIPAFANADFLIQVRGNSMWPKYNSGDLVACKRLESANFFQWNKVYVLDTDQGALIKKVKESKKENHILIVSENETYEPFDLDINNIRSISLVVGVLRLE